LIVNYKFWGKKTKQSKINERHAVCKRLKRKNSSWADLRTLLGEKIKNKQNDSQSDGSQIYLQRNQMLSTYQKQCRRQAWW
jgi:hypothetical protein